MSESHTYLFFCTLRLVPCTIVEVFNCLLCEEMFFHREFKKRQYLCEGFFFYKNGNITNEF